ncbi:hypothetical protein pb186bvf_019530 [Paramecium bursaria]
MNNFIQLILEDKFEQALKSLPSNYEQSSFNINFIAYAYQELEQYEMALDICQAFKDQNDIIILYRIGMLEYIQKVEFMKSNYFNKCVNTKANTSFEFKCHGDAYWFLDKKDLSEQAYLQAIKLDPRSVYALYAMGFILQDQKEYTRALEYYDQGLQLNNRRIDIWVNRGIIYLKQKKLDAALRSIENAISVNAKSYHAQYQKGSYQNLYNLGLVLKELDNLHEAIECFQMAQSIRNNKSTDPLLQMGSIYYQQNLYDQAMDCYEQILIINPFNASANYNKGDIFSKSKQDLFQSIIWLDKAIDLNPQYQSALVMKSSCLQELQRSNEAIKILEQVEKIDPNHESYNQKLGLIYYEKDNYDKALMYFQRQIKIKENASDYRFMAEIYIQKQNYNEALNLLNKSIQIDENYLQPYYRKAFVLRQLNQVEQATKFIEAFLKKYPKDETMLVQKANLIQSQGQNKNAQDLLQKAVGNSKDEGEIYFQKGLLHKNAGEYNEALKNFDLCLKHIPKSANTWVQKGQIYRTTNKVEEAIEAFNKALQIDSLHEDALYYLGSTYYDINHFKEAFKYYSTCVDINPFNKDAQRMKANVIRYLGDQQQSKQQFEELIEMFPDSHTICNDFASLLSAMGQKQKALQFYQKALQIKPDYYEAYFNQGIIYYQLGNSDEELVMYDLCLSINPNYTKALRNKALTLYYQSKYQESIQLYTKAIQIDPDYDDAYNDRGNSYKLLEQYDKAIQDYEKAIKIDPYNSSPYYNKGLCFLIQKKVTDAIQMFEKAIDLNSGNPLYHIQLAKSYNEIKETEIALKYLKSTQEALKGDLSKFNFRQTQLEYVVKEISILEPLFKNIKQVEQQIQKANPQMKQRYTIIQQKRQQVLLAQPKNKKEESQHLNDINQLQQEFEQFKQQMNQQLNQQGQKIQQQEQQLNQHRQQIGDLRQDVREIQDFLQDQMMVKKQLQVYQSDPQGFKYIAFYKGFYWTLSNYMNTYYQLSTGLMQVNYNTLIESKQEKAAEKAIKLSQFGQQLTEGIPFVGTVLKIIEKGLSMFLDKKLSDKFEERKNSIIRIVQQKCDQKDELETILAKAAVKVTDFRKQLILDLDQQEVDEENDNGKLMSYFKLIYQKFKNKDNQLLQSKYSLYGIQEATQILAYFYKFSQQISNSFLALDDKILEIFQLDLFIKNTGQLKNLDLEDSKFEQKSCCGCHQQ